MRPGQSERVHNQNWDLKTGFSDASPVLWLSCCRKPPFYQFRRQISVSSPPLPSATAPNCICESDKIIKEAWSWYPGFLIGSMWVIGSLIDLPHSFVIFAFWIFDRNLSMYLVFPCVIWLISLVLSYANTKHRSMHCLRYAITDG